jgi:AraC family transcriptional regulator of adaptative response/methylated-DNA-[protein]-cysteine methyltransferase
MTTQENINYNRIAEAIQYIVTNFKEQPELEEVAAHIHVSPFHFQRLFTDWAGVSPKKFLQYISVEHAKKILKDEQATLVDAALETGLSGTGRLHDLFISIEGMTPGEFKNGGESLAINYSFMQSPFGDLLIATTQKGICFMAFADDEQQAFAGLQSAFPRAHFRQMADMMQQNALYVFTHDWSKLHEIKLHIKGTPFQLKVWETLLKIPMGKLSSYKAIAGQVNQPNASRAVGTAVASNPVAFLIPCHRIIQSTGSFGQYHWGTLRKTAMIGWEAAKVGG